MYWIDAIGNISTVTSIFAVLFVALTVIVFLMAVNVWGSSDDDEKRRLKKLIKGIGVCAILFTLVAVFTPSTKSMYMIYGVGGTIDYLKENPTAKQLPDKIVMALDKWVDSQIEDEKGDKDK